MFMNDQFIGREREIKELRAAIRNNTKGILVYGPRQVGKTRLIQEAVSSDDFLPVVHECVTGSYEYNMELLAESIANATGMEYAKSIRDFFQMLSFLETLDNQKNIVLVIDEYQYLRETKDKGVVDSYLQRFIDSIKGKITVILCGSYVSAMKELLEYGNPLFSRLQIIIPLTTFDYLDSSLFYPHLSTNEKIAFYAVFGGYPFLLKNIDENESLEENIERLLLSPYGANRAIIENVLLQEAGRTGMPIEVLSRIGNSKVRYNEIEDMMTGDVSGTLDRILKRLISMEIIEKVSPINKRNERKRTFYEIHDNLIRFYFTYIYSLRTMPFRMKPGIILEKNILPSLNTYISKRFEVQVR